MIPEVTMRAVPDAHCVRQSSSDDPCYTCEKNRKCAFIYIQTLWPLFSNHTETNKYKIEIDTYFVMSKNVL